MSALQEGRGPDGGGRQPAARPRPRGAAHRRCLDHADADFGQHQCAVDHDRREGRADDVGVGRSGRRGVKESGDPDSAQALASPASACLRPARADASGKLIRATTPGITRAGARRQHVRGDAKALHEQPGFVLGVLRPDGIVGVARGEDVGEHGVQGRVSRLDNQPSVVCVISAACGSRRAS